jgi:hypothetical protein
LPRRSIGAAREAGLKVELHCDHGGREVNDEDLAADISREL